MPSQLIMSVSPWDVRAALVEDGRLVELYVERFHHQEPTGNIYKGRVCRVLPGMAAAFVDVGLNKPGYLFALEAAPSINEITEFWLRDEQAEKLPLKPSPRLSAPPIEDLLTVGQEMLVQVSRPPLGSKAARLTTHISLPGRFLVYLPTASHLAVSRRVTLESERLRLEQLLKTLKPEEGGLIARTASVDQSLETLTAERDTLVARWQKIRRMQHRVSAPGLLFHEIPVIRRLLRDLISPEMTRLVVDDSKVYEGILEYLKLEKTQTNLVELYTGQEPIFSVFHLEEDWRRLLTSQVWLKSGGYLIIDVTEALTAIDVNTGRFTRGKDLGETILTTNLEAAREAARQIRLRNLSGLIVLDFIDMEDQAQRELVCQIMQESFKKDRARTTIYPMSPLGLVEMTRQRLRDSLAEVIAEPCPCCQGQGEVISSLVVAHDLVRQLLREAREFANCHFTVTAHPEVIALVKQEGKDLFEEIQASRKILVHFTEDSQLPRDRFDITRELREGEEKV